MHCENCSKLAFFQKHHGCINCPRFCAYQEEKFCNYCSSTKNICSACGKSIKPKEIIQQDASNQIDIVHPFYKPGPCRSCGGRS